MYAAFLVKLNRAVFNSSQHFTAVPMYLQIVAVSECNLRYIPAVLFECITIKRLDISRNKFQMLPSEIGIVHDTYASH